MIFFDKNINFFEKFSVLELPLLSIGNFPNFVKPKCKFAKEYFSMYKTYHTSCDLSTDKSRFVCYRWMQRATMSCFATSTQRECTSVLDLCGAGARREIDHDAPPQV